MAVTRQTLPLPLTSGASHVDSLDPSTGEVVGRFETTQLSELPAIFENARQAQKEWVARSLQDRCAMLRRLRDTIYEHREEVADVITRGKGKARGGGIFSEI